MKTFITLVITILIVHSSQAQTFVEMQDSAYILLNKNRITTGALVNRSYPWVNLEEPKMPGDTLNYEWLAQAWQQLYLSTYNQSSIMGMDSVHKLLDAGNRNVISIGYIQCQYSAIDSDAVVDGRLVSEGNDGLLRDSAGMSSPYNIYSLAAPVVFTKKLGAGVHSFFFDPALVLKNISEDEIIAIKLTSGGNELILQPGETGNLNIEESPGTGQYLLDASLQMSNGDWKAFPYSFSDIAYLAKNYSQSTNICADADNNIIQSGGLLKFQGYGENKATQGIGQYKTFYHLQNLQGTNCDMHIRKPVIILDGFDPTDARKIISDPNNEEGIWDLLSYDDNGTQKHLGDQLRLRGYDVIILNFPNYDVPNTNIKNRDGGADYIERNGLVLVKLIQDINNELAANGSSEQIVIVGPSMGGQISRYALAWMEQEYAQTGKSKWLHNTRLWMSFDSPHLGANVPISAQQSLIFLGYHLGKQDAVHKYESQLRSIAARQLLIEQMDGLNGTAAFHQIYYSNLQNNGLSGSNGWPQNVRRIALLNGTNTGSKNGIEGGEAIHVVADAILGINVFDMKLRNMVSNGSNGKSLEGTGADVGPKQFFPGVISQTPTSYTVTNNMTLKRTLKIGWIGLLGNFKKVTTNESEYTTINANIRGSLDVVEGSTLPTYQEFADKVADQVKSTKGVKTVDKFVTYPTHTFIPSISALGSTNINYDWGVAFNKEYVLCSQATKFHNFFIPATNEPHVSLTQASVDWALFEVEQKKITPAISIYIGSDEIYTLTPAPPSGYIVQWSVGPGLQIINTNGNQVTVRGISYNNASYIKAEIKTSGMYCLVDEVQNTISVNYSYIDFPFKAESCLYIAEVYPFNPANSYYWSDDGINYSAVSSQTHVPAGTSGYTPSVGNNIPVYLRVNTNSEITQDVLNYFTVESPPSNNSCNYRSTNVEATTLLKVAPNPSSDVWYILSQYKEDRTISYELYDLSGKVIIQRKDEVLSAYSGIAISASYLAAGNYILKVIVGNEIQRFYLTRQ